MYRIIFLQENTQLARYEMTPNYQNTTLRHKLEIADGKQRED
jgi:hypothetical protein